MQEQTICPIMSSGSPDIKKCVGAQCQWWTRNDHGDFHCAVRVLGDVSVGILLKMIQWNLPDRLRL